MLCGMGYVFSKQVVATALLDWLLRHAVVVNMERSKYQHVGNWMFAYAQHRPASSDTDSPTRPLTRPINEHL